jgi:AcrR family transcriptional regulator
MNSSKAQTWLQAGHKLFANEGMEGIKIERLARMLNLNKSGFYHYFGSMKVYFQSLIEYHVQIAKTLEAEITKCQNIDPDLLSLIIKHQTFFLFESQLLVKSKPTHFMDDIDQAGKILNPELLQLWRKVMHLPDDVSVGLAYMNIVRHFFYARINPENIHYEFLHTLASETKQVLNKVIEESNVPSHTDRGPAVSE